VGLLARRLMVGGQIAVSLVLVTCAGIFLQSLWNRQAVSLGLRTDSVVTAQFVLGPRYAPPAARAAFYEQLEARLARLPGVESVALSDSLPPGGTPRSQPIFAPVVEGKPPFDEGTPGVVIWRAVTPDYFRALGIPILRGRPFTDDDRRPAERSIILSAAYARRLFGDENPLGRRMSRYPGAERNPAAWYTIVGVAADARNSGLTDHNDPEYYLARRRGSTVYEDIPMASAIIVRGGAGMAAMLRSEIAGMDAALPVIVRSFERHVAELASRPRFQAWLLVLFAAIGMLLAGFGLYGLVSFLVAQREREFGVRLALGATQANILKLVLGDALSWTLGGLVVGLAGAAVAARTLRSLLFHVSPGDPAAYVTAAAVLTTLAAAAAFVPSRRAARVDPAITLRQD
jgi:predicted permease